MKHFELTKAELWRLIFIPAFFALVVGYAWGQSERLRFTWPHPSAMPAIHDASDVVIYDNYLFDVFDGPDKH